MALVPGKHHWLVPGYYNIPLPRQIWRDNWFNLLTASLCLTTTLLLWRWCPPAVTHYFPYFEGVEKSYVGLKYTQPLRSEYIDIFKMGAISFGVPAGVMIGMNLWVLRDYYNANAALSGLSYALSTSALVACLLKIFVGGLRPNFYEICRPVYPTASSPSSSTDVTGTVHSPSYYTAAQVCTNTHRASINDSQMSFPSGHASSAFAGFVFLSIWLSAHLKIFGHTRHGTPTLSAGMEAVPDDEGRRAQFEPLAEPCFGAVPHWKLLASAAPLCMAAVLALSKIRDGWHHPVDVVCGAAIGTCFALTAYKMVFWSVWDAKINHVPRRKPVEMRA